MPRKFTIDKSIARLVDKSTFFKTLGYLDGPDVRTPCLVVDAAKVASNVARIGRGIRGCRVFYAVKANPGVEVVGLMDKLGVGFEISSDGELDILRRLGISPDRIICSNPVKRPTFIGEAARYGINRFAFDSRDEIFKIAGAAPGSSVYIRLTIPNEGSEWPLSKKFGVEIEEALPLLAEAKEQGLNPAGITFHVGSQCTNLYSWNIALDKARLLWDEAARLGITLTLLNLGGGYPVKYTRDVPDVETIERHIDALISERFGGIDAGGGAATDAVGRAPVEVHIEPGRAVIGDAGIIVAAVTGKAVRQGQRWLYIDVGVFNGLMESVGGIRYSYVLENHGRPGQKKTWVLAGPSCDSFDVIDQNVSLHEPEIGDYILVLSGGAYTVSYASEFNGCPMPETVIV
jgi:ornithine decarboxylase